MISILLARVVSSFTSSSRGEGVYGICGTWFSVSASVCVVWAGGWTGSWAFSAAGGLVVVAGGAFGSGFGAGAGCSAVAFGFFGLPIGSTSNLGGSTLASSFAWAFGGLAAGFSAFAAGFGVVAFAGACGATGAAAGAGAGAAGFGSSGVMGLPFSYFSIFPSL